MMMQGAVWHVLSDYAEIGWTQACTNKCNQSGVVQTAESCNLLFEFLQLQRRDMSAVFAEQFFDCHFLVCKVASINSTETPSTEALVRGQQTAINQFLFVQAQFLVCWRYTRCLPLLRGCPGSGVKCRGCPLSALGIGDRGGCRLWWRCVTRVSPVGAVWQRLR